MAAYQYVSASAGRSEEFCVKPSFSWIPCIRQTIISSGVWSCYLMGGLCVGAPTVIVPQMRREANSTAAVSDEMASWLSSINFYSGIPWILILSALSSVIGRKYPFLLVNIGALASFLTFYCSTNINHLLISQSLIGMVSAAQVTVAVISITEYTSPQYRGVFLTLKSATNSWGIWISNAVGTYFHWKNIGLIGICCASYSILTTLFWPESPSWLASKGKFEKCAVAHRWLKGNDQKSENELQSLIVSSKNYFDKTRFRSKTVKNSVLTFCEITLKKEYYKPILLSMATAFLYSFSGKIVCAVYAIDIIKKITELESTAYAGMLILDGITVAGMYVGCLLSKFFNRRTLLLGFSSCGIFFLYVISLYLYLVKLSIIVENNYVSIALLMAYSMSMSCGPLILTTSIFAEIAPLRYRNFSLFLFGTTFNVLLGSFLKLSPRIFKYFKLHGAFLFYAVGSSVLTLLLYVFLPETKDKTFKEIEDIMAGRKDVVMETELKSLNSNAAK